VKPAASKTHVKDEPVAGSVTAQLREAHLEDVPVASILAAQRIVKPTLRGEPAASSEAAQLRVKPTLRIIQQPAVRLCN
jgi:hypothetical protein